MLMALSVRVGLRDPKVDREVLSDEPSLSDSYSKKNDFPLIYLSCMAK